MLTPGNLQTLTITGAFPELLQLAPFCTSSLLPLQKQGRSRTYGAACRWLPCKRMVWLKKTWKVSKQARSVYQVDEAFHSKHPYTVLIKSHEKISKPDLSTSFQSNPAFPCRLSLLYLVYFLARVLCHSNRAIDGNDTRQHGNHKVLFERHHSVSHVDHFVGLPVNFLDENKNGAPKKTVWNKKTHTILTNLTSLTIHASTHVHPLPHLLQIPSSSPSPSSSSSSPSLLL